jgi:hypothetical protein
MVKRRWRSVAVTAAGLALFAGVLPAASAQGIFSCVDAQGRRITADRPILECNDVPQRELNRDGTLRRVVPPPPTAAERAAAAEKERLQLEDQRRQTEERQRQRALLARFPDAATLAREREASLVSVQAAIALNQGRASELLAERRRLEDEASFFAKEPARMPPLLRRLIDDNAQQLRAQEKLLSDQEQERLRISARFDAALRELAPVWAAQGQ